MTTTMQNVEIILTDGEQTDEQSKPLIPPNVPPWDKKYFSEARKDKKRTTSGILILLLKLFKLASYFVFGGLVLSSATISKGSLMILVNNAKPFNPESNDPRTQSIIPIDNDIIRAWSYIILLVALLIPEVLTMVYSLYRIVMKPEDRIDMTSLLWGGIWEVLHAVGEGILVLKVLPYLDVTVGLMMMPLIGIIPIGLHIFTLATTGDNVKTTNEKQRHRSKPYKRLKLVFGVIALILQLFGFATFCFCLMSDEYFQFFKKDATYVWAVVGIILTSARYWENFVSDDFDFKLFTIKAKKLQKNFDAERFTSSFVYSAVKCVILVGMTFLIFVVLECNTYASNYVNGDSIAYSSERYNRIIGLLTHKGVQKPMRDEVFQALWYVFALQTCGSFGAFYFGRVACLTMIQPQSFTLPLTMVTPVISACTGALGVYKMTGGVFGLFGFLGLTHQYKYRKTLSYYIDWNNLLFDRYSANQEMRVERSHIELAVAVIIVIGLCLGWMATALITIYAWKNPTHRLEKMEVLFVKPLYGGPLMDQVLLLNRRQNPRHYFNIKRNQIKRNESNRSHHTKRSRNPEVFLCATMWHETEQEMTQILTSFMRLDQHNPANITKKEFKSKHDEVFYKYQIHIFFDDAMVKNNGNKQVNKYVQQLLRLIPVAAEKVNYAKQQEVKCEYKSITPYGGRIKYILPCGNIIVIHLKDKDKIRHRKRWSQCMYMYYILAYMQEIERKDSKNPLKPEDVFLLALDGDVDFQPDAISYLMDRMMKNPQVGAACGRIHPIGSGPVVWFQKFEYAVGHWLQKTAEHVLGCVLCSPGSFSLFRGEALGDVMQQYTSKSTEAKHYVQWDQGEDRWLCTLLLKQGSRIEYSAASDSYTFAPESFKEFYNQRRRWGPSTMANVFDILFDAKYAVNHNTSLSWGYITYQIGLMLASLLGPATVIMVIQGAYQYVFKWSATVSFFASLFPAIIFIIFCFTTSDNFQIAAAGILTFIYATIMMAVMVGMIGSMVSNAIVDPNNLFMILLVVMYAFTGFVHPKEMTAMIHGMLYYLCVPSAFILLMIYSLANMNNVSWGTRDNSSDSVKEETSPKAHEEYQAHLGSNTIYDVPPSLDTPYSSSFGTLCHCAICIKPKSDVSVVSQGTQTEELMYEIDEKRTEETSQNDMKKISWIEQLKDVGEIKELDDKESKFWEYMIKKYLKPLEEDKRKRQEDKKDLAELRNKVIGAFFLLNALWLVLNFALQLTITDIAFMFWVAGVKISVNPVSFAFLLFFIVILIIQFFCMLKHRWTTALHFLAKQSLFDEKYDAKKKEVNKGNQKPVEETHSSHKRKKHLTSVGTTLSTNSFDNEAFNMDEIEERSQDEVFSSSNASTSQNTTSFHSTSSSEVPPAKYKGRIYSSNVSELQTIQAVVHHNELHSENPQNDWITF